MARNPGFAADAAYGAYLAAECVACHRTDVAAAPIPPLRYRPYEDLVAALKEYRDWHSGQPGDAKRRSRAR